MKFDKNQEGVFSKLVALHPHTEKWCGERVCIVRKWLTLRESVCGQTPYGVYLWGSVGSGKTTLIDAFLESSRLRVMRRHYHEFMLEFHDARNKDRGIDVIAEYAQSIRKQTDILFIDEFIVADIVDAMVLSELLFALAYERVFILTTTNTKVDNLYLGGFQRKSFLPAIKRIKTTFNIMNLNSTIDYRYDEISKLVESQIPKTKWFKTITNSDYKPSVLMINGHALNILGNAKGILLCDFFSICGNRRSASDYLSLAHLYHVLIITFMPLSIHDEHNDMVRRFINLIDVWYDHNRTILLDWQNDSKTIKSPMDGSWYNGTRLTNELTRSISRLHEMQAKYSKNKHTQHYKNVNFCKND